MATLSRRSGRPGNWWLEANFGHDDGASLASGCAVVGDRTVVPASHLVSPCPRATCEPIEASPQPHMRGRPSPQDSLLACHSHERPTQSMPVATAAAAAYRPNEDYHVGGGGGVAGMGSPSWAGCNGSATVAVQTCTCMQIRRCWTQLALPARLSAGSGSVGAGGGGGHGPPWLPTTGSRGLQAGVIGSGAAGGAVEGGCRCTWRMGQPWAASLSTPLHGGA
ncbi:hypothetical protein COCC4DRAFT_56634 [Bipolaris maydis ATCC 48331]|uniref:Uncharacterized protein n=1 Tax=Cochliobolus heterostrophus (strain C4 / ATCC 48331 / race T) TaxID=665024 RepID=N4X7W4_COCH4|nr:uncharacterized protein COCC4DRAFT_56634 [Bipolaris maydis ATCC 48331]ENI09114.1 hypothetical protein COCC4DRAFT_56634 [Bipolaris maydis ATCC 48331]